MYLKWKIIKLKSSIFVRFWCYKLSKIHHARCNIVNMFNTTRIIYNPEKNYDYIINSREELFNCSYKLIRNIKKFYYISPTDLKESINQYI